MYSNSGVGVSISEEDSLKAGKIAAQNALDSSNIKTPLFALLFSTSKHDPYKLVEGVNSVLGTECKIFGGYCFGIFTHSVLSTAGFEVGIIVIESDNIRLNYFLASPLPNNEFEVGKSLGKQIKEAGLLTDSSILLFYDSLHHTIDGKPRLNMASPMLHGISEVIESWPAIAGMGVMGDAQFLPSYQWFESKVFQQSAIALTFGNSIKLDTVVLHGLRPASRYFEVTKVDGPMIFEIDNRPAITVIMEILGPDNKIEPSEFANFITLGINKGDLYGEFIEEEYINRVCLSVDEKLGALIMFDNDISEGSLIQLMQPSIDSTYIQLNIEKLLQQVGHRKPLYALYIDCIIRASEFAFLSYDEVEVIRKAIPTNIPFLSIYSGVEIAKVKDRPRALDVTGVLCIFSENI